MQDVVWSKYGARDRDRKKDAWSTYTSREVLREGVEVIIKQLLRDTFHITQKVDLHRFFFNPQGGASARTVRSRQVVPLQIKDDEQDPPTIPTGVNLTELDHDNSILPLEFARYGDLATILQLSGYYDLNFPNRILWRIWKCCKWLQYMKGRSN